MGVSGFHGHKAAESEQPVNGSLIYEISSVVCTCVRRVGRQRLRLVRAAGIAAAPGAVAAQVQGFDGRCCRDWD